MFYEGFEMTLFKKVGITTEKFCIKWPILLTSEVLNGKSCLY